MKYMFIAGEASGDLHASRVIDEIRQRDPHAAFMFFGGDLMAAAADIKPMVHFSEMA